MNEVRATTTQSTCRWSTTTIIWW